MNKLIRFLLRPFLWIFFSLSGAFHALVGRFIGFIWFDIFRIRRKVILDNLRLAFPNISDSEAHRIARRSMSAVGRNIVDVFVIPFISKNWLEKNVEFVGYENYQTANAKNKGIMILSLHLGSGDLACACLSLKGIPLHVITKEFKSAWLNNFWFSARKKHGTKFISDRKSSFEILRALRKNESVVFVLDQYMGPPLGVKTKFFGVETGTAMGLALLAERANCPVLPIYTYYNEHNKLVIVIDKEIPLDPCPDHDQTILHMTQQYCDYIERVVRKFPEHWMWVHRRWKEFR